MFFLGAVQDYSAMYASVKNKGRTIGYIIEEYIGKLGMLNPFFAFGVVYFTWFVCNMIQAAAARDWDNSRVRIAMCLYILGDICLIGNLLLPNAGGLISTIFTYGTWIPYLPAVYLIAYSGKSAVNP